MNSLVAGAATSWHEFLLVGNARVAFRSVEVRRGVDLYPPAKASPPFEQRQPVRHEQLALIPLSPSQHRRPALLTKLG